MKRRSFIQNSLLSLLGLLSVPLFTQTSNSNTNVRITEMKKCWSRIQRHYASLTPHLIEVYQSKKGWIPISKLTDTDIIVMSEHAKNGKMVYTYRFVDENGFVVMNPKYV